MQIGKDTTIRLMIVDDSGEDAEAVVSAFRNDGIAIRPLRPLSADELASMLATQPIDLVLAAKSSRVISLQAVLAQVAASGKDIPVVALADAIDEAGLIADLALGARAVALRGRNDHVLSVLKSQWADLDARQEKIGYKIREAQLQKVPYMLVVGDREVAEGTVSVRTRTGGDQGASTVDAFVTAALQEVAAKGHGQEIHN